MFFLNKINRLVILIVTGCVLYEVRREFLMQCGQTSLFKGLSILKTSTDNLSVYEKHALNFCEYRQDNNDLSPASVGSRMDDRLEGLTSSGNDETRAFNEAHVTSLSRGRVLMTVQPFVSTRHLVTKQHNVRGISLSLAHANRIWKPAYIVIYTKATLQRFDVTAWKRNFQ
jgi:hypothetical protein